MRLHAADSAVTALPAATVPASSEWALGPQARGPKTEDLRPALQVALVRGGTCTRRTRSGGLPSWPWAVSWLNGPGRGLIPRAGSAWPTTKRAIDVVRPPPSGRRPAVARVVIDDCHCGGHKFATAQPHVGMQPTSPAAVARSREQRLRTTRLTPRTLNVEECRRRSCRGPQRKSHKWWEGEGGLAGCLTRPRCSSHPTDH